MYIWEKATFWCACGAVHAFWEAFLRCLSPALWVSSAPLATVCDSAIDWAVISMSCQRSRQVSTQT